MQSTDGEWTVAVEDTVLLRPGDPVDLDGDGAPDAGTSAWVHNPKSLEPDLALGVDGTVYARLSVDAHGTPDDPSDDTLGVYALTYDPEGPNAFCTSTLSSAGCLAQMSWQNEPSASQPEPFFLGGGLVSASSLGSLCYGLAGPAEIPFAGGTLCVAPPLRRMPPQAPAGLGGAGCSWGFAVDFNARIQSGSDPALVPGAEVVAQWLYRDNGAPNGTGFTNAVRFVIRP